eukprot:CAMPEP_0197617914 /NCGR_PEP_ID=MMETSP1326-20131121/61272_1 /TAXON_ID=1155430 /ORGANISM="Genus nov. species nov., Strain RCC2288" /LENGTH=665 /DNA_ID=CAMNT_0043186809 /DNA_START=304 /DNA_END=2298 /DNA_ORIENTATION=-
MKNDTGEWGSEVEETRDTDTGALSPEDVQINVAAPRGGSLLVPRGQSAGQDAALVAVDQTTRRRAASLSHDADSPGVPRVHDSEDLADSPRGGGVWAQTSGLGSTTTGSSLMAPSGGAALARNTTGGISSAGSMDPSGLLLTPSRRTSNNGMGSFGGGLGGGLADLGGIFAACAEASYELELAVRAAVSHREKCAVVLGAAVAVSIALTEADAVSPGLDAPTQTQLKRLCSGILSTLGLAVARVRVYGQYTRAQKIVRLMRYRATDAKFDELCSDLEVLEGQLWNLTGAVGGLGIGGNGSGRGRKRGTRRHTAGPDTSHRLLRGGAQHWMLGGDVRVMCAAGVDGSELWWASHRSASLSAYDLFLQSHRNIDGLVAPMSDEGGPGGSGSGCLGICLSDDVTAMAAEEESALLWTGTKRGGVATWDTDAGCQWGSATVVSASASARPSPVTAVTPVARGTAWVGLADGSLLEVSAAEKMEQSSSVTRVLCSPGSRPLCTTAESESQSPGKEIAGLGWGSTSGRKRHGGVAVRELLRLGPLVWASADDGVLEAWDAETGLCAALCPHRDLGPCVAIAPHAAAGQLVTVHATGAVQMWWAVPGGMARENSTIDSADEAVGYTAPDSGSSSNNSRVLGTRAGRLAGPQPAGGKVVGAAVVDRLLCIGHA